MQFSGESNGLDLYSDARFLCGIDETTDTTTYPIKAFTRNANFALAKYTGLALTADANWKYDDSNQTGELLDVTNNLVSGTQKVSLGASWLKVEKVRIKDPQGNWISLARLDRKRQTDSQLTATSGTPEAYFILGNYLYFDKAPNYSSAAGIEVQFQRGPSYFTYTDTTKTPGWAEPYHRLVSLEAAKMWCSLYAPNRVPAIMAELGTPPDLMNNQPGSGLAKAFVDYYSQRDGDEQPTIRFKHSDYGEIGLGNSPASTNPKGFDPLS